MQYYKIYNKIPYFPCYWLQKIQMSCIRHKAGIKRLTRNEKETPHNVDIIIDENAGSFSPQAYSLKQKSATGYAAENGKRDEKEKENA